MKETPSKLGIEYLTIQEYIDAYTKAKNTYDKSYLDPFNEIHMLDIFDNFLNDYFHEHTTVLQLSPTEVVEFRYNPKALSYKLYQTPNMWEVILRMNSYSHPGQMDLQRPLSVPTIESIEYFFTQTSKIKDAVGGYLLDFKDAMANKK